MAGVIEAVDLHRVEALSLRTASAEDLQEILEQPHGSPYTFEGAAAAAVEMTHEIVTDPIVKDESGEAAKIAKFLQRTYADNPHWSTLIGYAGLIAPRVQRLTGIQVENLDASKPEHFPLAVEYLCNLAVSQARELTIREWREPVKRTAIVASIAVKSLL
jgi:hypothetical protein